MNPATAKTSLNQVPALHKFVASLDLSVFDFGAGKQGKVDEFFFQKRIQYVPYDPFNRTKENNELSWGILEVQGVDIVTCANVLNVLDDSDLVNCIHQLRYATGHTRKGMCFVSVYHAPSKPRGLRRKGYVQRNEPLSEYAPLLKKEFDKVWNVGKFLACSI